MYFGLLWITLFLKNLVDYNIFKACFIKAYLISLLMI